MENNLIIKVTLTETINAEGEKQKHNYDVIFTNDRVIYREEEEVFYSAKETPFTFYQFMDKTLKSKYCRKLVAEKNWLELTVLLLHFYNPKDSGRYGKILEVIVKLYLHGYRGRVIISPTGHVDLKHKGIEYECKSNCGDLMGILFDNIKATGVLYSEDNIRDCVEPWNVRVYELNDFVESFKGLGLIRKRRGTDGIVKFAIQSYTNSKRKHNAMIAMQEAHPTIETIR